MILIVMVTDNELRHLFPPVTRDENFSLQDRVLELLLDHWYKTDRETLALLRDTFGIPEPRDDVDEQRLHSLARHIECAFRIRNGLSAFHLESLLTLKVLLDGDLVQKPIPAGPKRDQALQDLDDAELATALAIMLFDGYEHPQDFRAALEDENYGNTGLLHLYLTEGNTKIFVTAGMKQARDKYQGISNAPLTNEITEFLAPVQLPPSLVRSIQEIAMELDVKTPVLRRQPATPVVEIAREALLV